MTTLRRPFAFFLLVIFAVSGCGGPTTYPVDGKVVYQGDQTVAKDLVGHVVTLESLERAVSATGTVTADGTFTVSTFADQDGAVPGKHRVAISPPLKFVEGPMPKPLVAPRFGSLEASGLEITVGPGSNAVTLEVERATE